MQQAAGRALIRRYRQLFGQDHVREDPVPSSLAPSASEAEDFHLEKMVSRRWRRKAVGGEGGIRTRDTLASMPHFECGAFNHSATSPKAASPSPRPQTTQASAPPRYARNRGW